MVKNLETIVVNNVELKKVGEQKVDVDSHGGGSKKFLVPENAAIYETNSRDPHVIFYYVKRTELFKILTEGRFIRIPRGAAAMKFGTFYFDGGNGRKPFYDSPRYYNLKGNIMREYRR